MDELTIAMPKGRIFEEAYELLVKAGYDLPKELDDSRKLIVEAPNERFRFILAKPMDVPVYVEHGVADIGIAGKDVMLELDRSVHELLDLGISRCYIATAGLPNTEMNPVTPRIATKYPKIASRFYRGKGEQVEIIELNGSIELAPMIGLADRIVDIVSTGKTLKENGLVEYEQIVDITSRLIANPVSYRLKQQRIRELVENLRKQAKA
ncbi:ATP phosphoribosyltransferase [Planomicrobium chinense]|uniref:ATP phosphoribosyltransferase n=2 Tax=Planococcus TaxID=1372 RepID=A0A1G8DXS1_9BACL|nr:MULTISPECIES: ATP phosphoribosyltransferase [Planococcus]MCP2036160.1 ATP phosphoribosyltransferase [Planomicrobium sp. HSC-17F08]ETP68271.1 ATP phosphoribosyltransferase [Planococcus glaciei CHR43]KOF10072.1 ATP phosphoribosyltransferase [Planococcus glaciei]MBX0316095.1 ATP phosphoribosyltransferase [Planococcus glaciei]MBZ5202487.1 ATP phosphoribosyltransferase [Planococcus chinensis]